MRLLPDVDVIVGVDDRSAFGSPLSTRPDDATRELFASVLDHVTRHGVASLATDGPALLEQVVASTAFEAVAERDPTDPGCWRLHDHVLFPDPRAATFRTLRLERPERPPMVLELTPGDWPAVHALLARLSDPEADSAPTDALTSRLLDLLVEHGFIDRGNGDQHSSTSSLSPSSRPAALRDPGLTFVGHNTVVVRSTRCSVVIDPFLRPARPYHESGYQPLTRGELGPIDAIAITHSHPDHFDPGSLLRFDPEITVIVPVVERESLLAVAMAERLRQLGFRHVVELPWWHHHRVGDIEVHATPFYGEQPTDGDWLHPTTRNVGNTYVVSTPDITAAFLADSGRDHAGDSRDLGVEAGNRVPRPDIVFAGYRGWRMYPVQHLLSSVARYLLFVPRSRWSGRMRLMNDFDDAIDCAERWGASRIVPYADGGAPWFWEMGLGPRLDDQASEIEGYDPFPERIFEHAAARVTTRGGNRLASPVDVRLLRPNDSILVGASPDGYELVTLEGNTWPWDRPER